VKLIALTALLLAVAMPLAAQDESLKERAEKLLKRVEARPDKAWDYAFALRSMADADGGEALIPVFEESLENDNAHVRLVCAQLVIAKGRAELAHVVLGELLEDEDSAVVEAAATMIGREGPEDEEVMERLRMRWEDSAELSNGARVALCEALLVTTKDELALERLREFLSSNDHELLGRAALVLAERGHAAEVGERVRSLANEPGEIARLARVGVEVNKVEQAVADLKAGKVRRPSEDFQLIREEIRAIRKHYVVGHLTHNEKQYPLDNENLVDAACRAMSGATDRYAAYLTSAEIAEMNQDQQGSYVGIGAHVSQGPDGLINIDQPIYEGPAYAAGVRSGDKLIGVNGPDGKRIDLTKVTLEEGVQHVRGPEGSTATIYIKRPGVADELVFEIKRKVVHVDTALEEMLPGDVGYVRLTRFGTNSDDDMKASLINLRRKGMKYLVLDLRGNGGGSLETVLNIADMFLPKGKRIATAWGLFGVWKGKQEPYISNGGDFNDVPMVVLIDGDSASGSEMLAGALKDNDRATLLGRKSFGKDIGQSFFPVDESGNKRWLKCTVFSYLIPSGVSIGRANGTGGITPHIRTNPELLEAWEVYAIDKLRKSKKLDEYLDRHYVGEKKPEMMKLAFFDALEHQRWPGFQQFYKGLDTNLAEDDVRRELRYALRVRVQDDRGAEFTQNYQEDPTLLRGVDELMKKAGKEAREIAEYKAVMK
jgi:C-terminal peptidase prc